MSFPKLTKREIELVPLLVAGATRDDIANSLGVSSETIKSHIRNLVNKFGGNTVRDVIVGLTNYDRYFISGDHKFFVPVLYSTIILHENRKDAEVLSDFDIVAIHSGVDKLTELYRTDGAPPKVTMNGENITQQPAELGQFEYTYHFSKPLKAGEIKSVQTHVFYPDAYGKNIEAHINRIADPTDRLVLAVEFRGDVVPDRVFFNVRKSLGNYGELARFDHHRQSRFEIVIDDPQYMLSYFVRWIWDLNA